MIKEKINKIAVLCPSRDRLHNALGAKKSWEDSTTKQSSDFFIVCDSDQSSIYSIIENLIIAPKTDRRGMNDPVNYAASILSKQYKYVMFIGDDHRFRTKDWDIKFIQEYENNLKYGYIYGNDLLQGANLPTACCISSDIIENLGYMSHPSLIHLYIDNYWLQMGKRLNKIVYFDNIIIEHMHPAVGKAQMDEAYQMVNSNLTHSKDSTAFSKINFEEEINKLKNLYVVQNTV